ncbi:uncharacterized protein ATNIH1004_008739 [Aspergillus tanneri]|uniref:Uncharacterized protein n=1 Tax=Aspergillus tanneri TaxID=1220188 RepID=A0A5M9MBW6_9EURO|nr:uncharacterized protein ATNIH1004_008739 [Aspergillus tanneri]KAA8644535.1 hypothetical protein ATNIH1004_008739 [Aspergillus tanneri]
MREENEAAAFKMREQMQAVVKALAEENKALKEDLVVSNAELQRRTSELRAYKIQMEAWKAKLPKFRDFLNELGSDYKVLRGESVQLKATRTSLDRERKDIEENITSARELLRQVTSLVGERRSRLSETVHSTDLLKQNLKNTEEKVKLVREQLSDEKKRTAALETYIREQTSVHGEKLCLIRSDQAGMIEKLDSRFQSMSSQLGSFQSSTESIFGSALDECRVSLKLIDEKHSAGQTDVRRVEEIIHKSASQMEAIQLEIANEIHGSSEANGNLVDQLKQHLQYLGDSVNNGLNILRELSANEQRCSALQESFQAFVPSLESLNLSVKEIGDKESDLAQQMEHIGRSITEINIPEKVELSSAEAFSYSQEKLELEQRLQELSTELRIAKESIEEKQICKEEANHALHEAMGRVRETEQRAKQFESQTIELQDRIKKIEIEVREELNRASVISRDQCRARYEQQVHGLRALAAKEVSTKEKQAEIERLLLEKEEKIHAFEISHAEISIALIEKDEYIRMLQETEKSNAKKLDSLQQQLNEAGEKLTSVEGELSTVSTESQKTSQELQKKLESLCKDLSKKEEEYKSKENELSAVCSAKSDLEHGKSKAKAEIHALLRRVQDAESWVKSIKEVFGQVLPSSIKEQIPDAWNKLQGLLQSTDAQNPPEPNSIDSTVAINGSPKGHTGTSMVSTPQKDCRTPGKGSVHKTEFIYRTESIQRSLFSSPIEESSNIETSKVALDKPKSIQHSQPSTDIVPFSSIRQQISLARCSTPEENHNDLATMLGFTPSKSESPGRPDVINKPSVSYTTPLQVTDIILLDKEVDGAPQISKDTPIATQAVSIGEHISNQRDTSKCNTPKQKTVTFEGQDLAADQKKIKVSNSRENDVPASTPQKPQGQRKITRTNQRTYSRTQQSSFRSRQEMVTHQQSSSHVEETGDRDRPEGPSPNKKTRSSLDSSYTRTKTKAASEYFEPKASPASLASGSSKYSSAHQNYPNSTRWSRGSRGGRKTRGDRYNARFNRET